MLYAFPGVGIREEKLESIFEAFAQVQTGQVTGTGLGLFGVCRRAEGLQGACGARHNTASSTGTGTVIWFSIPYVIDHTESLGNSALDRPSPTSLSVVRSKPGSLAPLVNPATLTSQIRERGLVAMVVDDTLSIRKLMERTLLQLGFERVVCFENGSKGLDALMAEAVDIVFTDVQMPIMTGPEVSLFVLPALVPTVEGLTSLLLPFAMLFCYYDCRWCSGFALSRRAHWPAAPAAGVR
jgi:hypothetical protein